MSVNITRINNADPNCADTFNRPISEIESKLNDLYSKVTAITNKSSIVIDDVLVSSDCSLGSLIYLDANDGICKPAQALLDVSPGSTGESVEAPCSRVIGMVISKSGNRADVLIGGQYTSITCAENCMGLATTPGTYYLSATQAGKATLVNETLKQPVLTYWGSGTFTLNIFYMAHDNHFHESLNLLYGWSPVTVDDNPPQTSGGVTPTYKYNASLDSAFQRLGDLSSDNITVFENGSLDVNSYVASKENLWCTHMPAGNVVLFTFFPYVYGNPVVRSLVSASNDIEVSNNNGIVTLKIQEYSTATPIKTPVAVSGVSGRTLNTTPVITGAYGVGGVKVLSNSLGEIYVGMSNYVASPIQASEISLNGTKYASDDTYTYIVFPAGVTSSFTMAYSLSDMSATTTSGCSIWLQHLVGTMNASYEILWVPLPSATSPSVLPTPTGSTHSIALNGSAAGKVYYAEGSVADRKTITGPGRLVAKVTINNTGASDFKVLTAGFILYQDTVEQGMALANNSMVSSIVSKAPAGVNLSANKVLTMSGGKLYLASNTTASTSDKLCGISLDTVAANSDCRYIVNGIHQNTNWNFTEGGLLYVGINGEITQTIPTTGYIQKIGWALTSNTILVDFSGAILTSVPTA